MSDVPVISPPTPAPNRDVLAQYVHDAYELEKKIFAMEKLTQDLDQNRADFERKEKKRFPQKPVKGKTIPKKVLLIPQPIITKEEEKSNIQAIEKKCEENTKKEHKPIISSAIISFVCAIVSSLIATIFVIPSQKINGLKTVFIVWGATFLLIFFILRLKNHIHKSQIKKLYREKIKIEKERIIAHNHKVKSFNGTIPKENEKRESENIKIDVENERIKRQYEKDYQKFLDEQAIARIQYDKGIQAYNNQCRFLADSLAELKEIRVQMYAINILAPDYREMKHLHYFDHYFRNGLVNTMQEAIIMYRQEAYQEMVGMTLSSILSSINNLTGEVRALGMTLQSIQAEVTAIGQDSMHIRLLQEDLLMTAQESATTIGALFAETRATRYATEAVKENTDRLRWYEEQRYYGYL